MADQSQQLRKTLGPLTLWGLGVGYVISGEYFGWNLGLAEGGSFGMLFAFILITVMYITFVFSYTEMACAIPRAGGVFVYAQRAYGTTTSYVSGIAQFVEFVFAPPAIAKAIGSYAELWLTQETVKAFNDTSPFSISVSIAVVAYIAFTLLNIWGVQQAALFELFVTIAAAAGLLLFTFVALPHFSWVHFSSNAWPKGWTGAFAAIPFAIWFYLAIEGVANAAEEAVDPQRDVSRGFGGAILTLVALATLAFFLSVGIGGWERVVYPADNLTMEGEAVKVIDSAQTSDSPLPLAVAQIKSAPPWVYHTIVAVGLLGLIASFNGIILAAGRASFEMGRVGFFLRTLGQTHSRTKTPVNALVLNLIIGVVAILFLDTGGLITMSAFGAVTLYITSMMTVVKLRKTEPKLDRPYRTPFFPVFPIVALLIAVFSLVTMAYFNLNINDPMKSYTLWYFGYLAIAMIYYWAFIRNNLSDKDIAHFKRID